MTARSQVQGSGTVVVDVVGDECWWPAADGLRCGLCPWCYGMTWPVEFALPKPRPFYLWGWRS